MDTFSGRLLARSRPPTPAVYRGRRVPLRVRIGSTIGRGSRGALANEPLGLRATPTGDGAIVWLSHPTPCGSRSWHSARWSLSVAAVGSTDQAKLAGDRSDRRPRRWGRLGRRSLRSVVWQCRSYSLRIGLARAHRWNVAPAETALVRRRQLVMLRLRRPRVRVWAASTPWNCLRAARQATWPPVGRDRLRRVRR